MTMVLHIAGPSWLQNSLRPLGDGLWFDWGWLTYQGLAPYPDLAIVSLWSGVFCWKEICSPEAGKSSLRPLVFILPIMWKNPSNESNRVKVEVNKGEREWHP